MITDKLIQDEHGEVCPANWTNGSKAIKPTPTDKLEYFSAANSNGVSNDQTNGHTKRPRIDWKWIIAQSFDLCLYGFPDVPSIIWFVVHRRESYIDWHIELSWTILCGWFSPEELHLNFIWPLSKIDDARFVSQQNKLSAGEKRERQKDFLLNCNYIPKCICIYPKQMLRQMEFPRQLDVIP